MIQFEIKPQIVEFLVETLDFEGFGGDDAQIFIEQLMGLMIAHKCITMEPEPDAALLAALHWIADGWSLDAEEMSLIARAAIARAEGDE